LTDSQVAASVFQSNLSADCCMIGRTSRFHRGVELQRILALRKPGDLTVN
jgi:hypothetical protein